MNFFLWNYSQGINLYFQNWWLSLRKINHFFSLSSLFSTLFYPWKRLSIDNDVGFNIKKFFENLSFNLISISIGFTVRIFLIIFCLLSLIITSLFYLIFLFIYICLPFLSLPWYFKSKINESIEINNLLSSKGDLFISPAGKFILKHLNSSPELIDYLSSLSFDQSINPVSNFESYFKALFSQHSNVEESLAKFSLSTIDIILAARWWDLSVSYTQKPDKQFDLGRPGIGSNLVYGYSVNLDKHSEDLSLVKPYHHRLIGRTNLVTQIKNVLESGRSVILTGQPGVGRMTVVFEFTHKLITGQLGRYFNCKRVLRLDYQSAISSGDVENKRTIIKNLLIEAERAGNIILVIKDFQRLVNPGISGYDFTDVISDVMSHHKAPFIALCDTNDYQRYISLNPRINKYFDVIEVTPPTTDEAMDILLFSASENEKKSGVTFTISCLRKLLDGSDRFINDIPFPEKVLELLTELTIQKSSSKNKIATVEDAVTLLSEKTKIPMTSLTDSAKAKLSNIEDIIHQTLIGQDNAIKLIGKSLRTRAVGLKNQDRPIGSFLFLGPTGVGKTETAKVLSRVYFGDEDSIIRFNMAEYAGSEGISRLIGSSSQNQLGSLTTAIKEKPASLVLFDEIEKAPPEVFNLLLTLLDEGYITDAFNQKIICSNIFVIATSNAGAEFIRQQVSQQVSSDNLQKSVVNFVQQNHIFSNEFLNRFDGVVVYEPLDKGKLNSITRLMLQKLQDNLRSKNIFMEYDENVIQKLVDENYEPSLGARPIRRAIDIVLSDIFSQKILNNQIVGGDKVHLSALGDKDQFKIEKVVS